MDEHLTPFLSHLHEFVLHARPDAALVDGADADLSGNGSHERSVRACIGLARPEGRPPSPSDLTNLREPGNVSEPALPAFVCRCRSRSKQRIEAPAL
jgi:hypothetical protein